MYFHIDINGKGRISKNGEMIDLHSTCYREIDGCSDDFMSLFTNKMLLALEGMAAAAVKAA